MDIEERRIKSSLKEVGVFASKKIADTLQGQIWSVIHAKSKRKYVVKTASKKLHRHKTAIMDGAACVVTEDIVKEARILKYLKSLPQCPLSIIAYKASFHSNHHYFLLMEHGGNSLFDFVQNAHRFLERNTMDAANWMLVVRCIFKQMTEAIDFLHSHHIAHSDISLENFTLSKDPNIAIENIGTENEKISFVNIERELQIKLIDFGLAERFVVNEEDGKANFESFHFVGKRAYQCPEIRQGEAYDAAANDVWCLGVCLFMMATGNHPWQVAQEDDDNFKLIYLHDRLQYVLHVWRVQHIDDDLVHLLQCIFQPQADRISLPEIAGHAWLTGDCDIDRQEKKQ